MAEHGYIYILTNPSFPDYVKIGYADDDESRLKRLNRSECIPFAFRLYAYYKVDHRLTDIKLHKMIDKLNPNLRSVEEFDGKTRKREFYFMPASDAYGILEAIAELNSLEKNLVLVEPTAKEIKDEEVAEENRTKKSPTQYPKMDWLIEQGIVHPGDEIYIINHPDEKGKVVDADNVLYKGNKMSYNQFGCKITGWKAIQVYAWAKVNDSNKTLDELRKERMKELGLLE